MLTAIKQRFTRRDGRRKTATPSTPPPLDPFPTLTAPPCLIMLGGLGDVLIALCIARHYAERFGVPTPFLTSPRYQNVLGGCSYVRSVGYSNGPPWYGYQGAIQWARSRFPAVFPLHVGDKEIQENLRTTRFCHEQYLYAGVGGRYGDFPLVFDRRNPEREAQLVRRIRDGRPMCLYNLSGRSSPFDHADALLHSLQSRWGSRIQLVNISKLDLSHYQDLLGLLDASIGMLSVDTSSIHLMPASSAPYIALLNDTKSPWWSSVPRGPCALALGYTKVMDSLPAIHETIETMLSSQQSLTIPESSPAPTITLTTPAPEKPPMPAAHLVTLACGGMEAVWNTAKLTWEPFCATHKLSLEATFKAPRPDLAPSWNKIPIVLDALDKHEVVWWIDSDITVAPSTTTLPDSDADLLFATDWNGLCAGMFRARATEWARNFLRAALLLGDVRDPNEFGKNCGVKWEQNAIKLLLREFPSTTAHVALLPATFVCDRPGRADRNPNASFYHFGGMPNHARIAAMQKLHNF